MASADVILKYVNQTKIKGSCQSGRKVVTYNSKSDLSLALHVLSQRVHARQYFWCPYSDSNV